MESSSGSDTLLGSTGWDSYRGLGCTTVTFCEARSSHGAVEASNGRYKDELFALQGAPVRLLDKEDSIEHSEKILWHSEIDGTGFRSDSDPVR